MTAPPPPDGYDRAAPVTADHEDCAVTFGFDISRGTATAFLVQLLHSPTRRYRSWSEIARIDHNPAAPDGHDLYAEGIHVDVTLAMGGEKVVYPNHDELPSDTGVVLRVCITYLQENAGFSSMCSVASKSRSS